MIDPAPMMPPASAPIQLYANGYSVGVTNCDVVIHLQLNGRHVYTLNVSTSFAKTIGIGLSETITKLEKATETRITTAQDFDTAAPNFKNAIEAAPGK